MEVPGHSVFSAIKLHYGQQRERERAYPMSMQDADSHTVALRPVESALWV